MPDEESTQELVTDERLSQFLSELESVPDGSVADHVSDGFIQRLLTVAVKLYAARLDDEVVLFPFAGEEALTPTEVGMTVGHMIKAADIDLFELVSWQSLRGN